MKSSIAAAVAALFGVTACMGNAPGPVSMNAGVGFGDYQNYLREREGASARGVPYSVPPEQTRAAAMPINQTPYAAPVQSVAVAAAPRAPVPTAANNFASAQPLATQPLATQPLATQPLPPVQAGYQNPYHASATVGAPLSAPMHTGAAPAPVIATALPPASQPVPGTSTSFGTTPAFDAGGAVRPTISNEQDFAAVSARETIESDRERLARQREQFQAIQVTSVPDASVSGGPNLMEFALNTRHPVGTQVYTRLNPLRWTLWENACLQFRNQEAAQSAFLAAGGPDRDSGNLDPDGDGYACWWDPAPYRQAGLAATR